MFGFLWNLYPAIGSGMRASISAMMASTSSIELGFSATGSSGNLLPVLRAWNRSSAAWRALVVIRFLLAILKSVGALGFLPGRRPPLEHFEELGQGDADEAQQDDDHEQLVGGEGVAVDHDREIGRAHV